MVSKFNFSRVFNRMNKGKMKFARHVESYFVELRSLLSTNTMISAEN